MLKDRVDAIVYQIAQTNLAVKTPFQGLLETKMGALSPLSIVKKDDRYSISFSHPSLGYCLIAEILIENLFKPDFPNKETQQMWGHNYLSKIPEVLGPVYNSSPTPTCRGLSAASRRWSNYN